MKLEAGILACAVVFAAACSGGGEDVRHTSDRLTWMKVTGQAGDPTANDEQSETAMSVQTYETSRFVTVTYNDMTGEVDGGFMDYGPNSRRIHRNASLMGWSVSSNDAQSFDYGGKVRPPPGWAVLWGDPAITSSRRIQSYVYIQNIAISDSRFPAIGYIDGSVTEGCAGGPCPDSGCIARSRDSGRSFEVRSQDCVTNSGHFYDGGSMTSDGDGAIYASWVDWTDNAIDVWRAADEEAAFVRLPRPFQGQVVQDHPRIQWDVESKRLYAMTLGDPCIRAGEDELGQREDICTLYADYWDGSSWHGAVSLAGDVVIRPTISRLGGNRAMRTGPQFSFDVGTPSVNQDDAIRVTYTSRSIAVRKFLRSVRCTADLACSITHEWSTSSYQGQQWNPVVRAQRGFIGVPAVWKVSFSSTQDDPDPSGSTLGFYQGGLVVTGSGARFFPVGNLIYRREVCPDTRGYWGDYDDVQVLSISASGSTTFLRSMSDSQPSCSYQWDFTSSPLHVSGVTFQ